MDERTTSELIETLGNDVARCHAALVAAIDAGEKDENGSTEADHEYHARQLIRAVFAFIEAVTFSVKVHAAELGLDKGLDITDAERFFATDTEHVLTDKGEIVERPARIRLSDNVRFAFRLQEKVLEIKKPFDSSVSWWSDFKSSIKIRDRLTHPKMPGDTDVSGNDIVTVLKAYDGFKKQVLLYVSQRKT